MHTCSCARPCPRRRIQGLAGEIAGVLRPGETFVCAVRHTGDPHYGLGTPHGDDIYKHGGFAVHFFDRDLVDALPEGWRLAKVHAFEEGPRACPGSGRGRLVIQWGSSR
ncbi:hypothetical protein ACFCZY_04095 [Streptomyces sp. NPDC056237]|uniref:hypothetical protein n=1 Tax=unclassified Streptomyces TaxID=2593676 RepID=UPI0035DD626E